MPLLSQREQIRRARQAQRVEQKGRYGSQGRLGYCPPGYLPCAREWYYYNRCNDTVVSEGSEGSCTLPWEKVHLEPLTLSVTKLAEILNISLEQAERVAARYPPPRILHLQRWRSITNTTSSSSAEHPCRAHKYRWYDNDWIVPR